MQHGAGAGRMRYVRACPALASSTLVITEPLLMTWGVGA
jgi:hypothetical protein